MKNITGISTAKVKVMFYNELGGVLAVFPTINEFNGYRYSNKRCYSHVGQHSVANPDYYRHLKKAKPEELAPLVKELKAIGYDLEILNK